MKKIKIKLNKKVISALSKEEMGQAQGGNSYYGCDSDACLSITCWPSVHVCPSEGCPSEGCPSASVCISTGGDSFYNCCR